MIPAHSALVTGLSGEAIAHSTRLCNLIKAEIGSAGGWISFARYMDLALHAPGLGYYSAGALKLGADADFITAPELGALFARTIARQAAQIMQADITEILEIGAGSGTLACELLRALQTLNAQPERYLILETSADLRQRQQQRLARELPALTTHVEWLDRLPPACEALIVGNEVLDALPVHLVETRSDGIDELGVIVENDAFGWRARPAAGAVLAAAAAHHLPPGYRTEIHLPAQALIRSLAGYLTRGVILIIDYGFPASEFYHPQRNSGTLMCHYRQRAHTDPFYCVGLQDISAHVDFSAIATSAVQAGCAVMGYANQAQFLINCGITEVLASTPAADAAAYLPLAAQAQTLLSAAEMGELFKVLAVGREVDIPLTGFRQGDKRHTL